MNKERILTLASIIEQQPHVAAGAPAGFCLNTFFHFCGTPSCIAGYAIAQARREGFTFQPNLSYTERAAKYLGLGNSVAFYLCIPPQGPEYLSHQYADVTPAMAAKVLRHLADTGRVDWSIV